MTDTELLAMTDMEDISLVEEETLANSESATNEIQRTTAGIGERTELAMDAFERLRQEGSIRSTEAGGVDVGDEHPRKPVGEMQVSQCSGGRRPWCDVVSMHAVLTC